MASTPPKPPPADAGPAPAARSRVGVVFVHGTSDLGTDESIECHGSGDAYRCTVEQAIEQYWPRPTVDSERTRADGSMRPYAIIGCPLASQTPWPNASPVQGSGPEPGSAACVAYQIARFLDGPDGQPGTPDDIASIAIVTHSGGGNVMRYILQQHTASAEHARVHAAARVLVAIAAPFRGTYMADALATSPILGLGAAFSSAMGGGRYDDDGGSFLRTAAMAAHNRDPAKLVDLAKDVAGVPALVASGTSPDANGDPSRAACGGGAETTFLQLLHDEYLTKNDPATYRDGCSDGFIPCQSAMALANGDRSRVIFGRLDDGTVVGDPRHRAHQQSRLSCSGLDLDIRAAINEWLARADAAAGTIAAPVMRKYEVRSLGAPAFVHPGVARIVSTQAREGSGVIEVAVDVDVAAARARLGLRAELVATDERGREWTIATAQSGADATHARHTLALRLPTTNAPRGATLSVRDLVLISHDRAEVLDAVSVVRTPAAPE